MKTAISKDGTAIAYDVYGSGPALIYITGASCFRAMKPTLQSAKVFAREFTVYNYDRRGRGDSGNTLPYAAEHEVEDIEALINAAGGMAFLYGHSSGAVLALESAMRLGGKVKKIVMYDPPYVHDATAKNDYDSFGRKILKLLDDGENSEAMSGFLKGIGVPRLFILLIRLSRDWKKMVELAPTLAYDISLTSHMPPIERASRITVPIQIVVGEKSPASIFSVAEQLTKAIPNAKFVQLKGQDHIVDPKALLPMLSSFLN
jgi:pimeloyl-ACP methyl ester carboxylesterase